MSPPDTATRPAAGTAARLRRPGAATLLLAASILVGTALLLWGVDWLARFGAQSLLARNVQAATGVAARPSVHLHGVFFLPQVVRGRYDDVEITVHGLTSGPLRIEQVHADLRGAHLPLHDVLVQNSVPIYVEHTQERATLDYQDLNRYLKATGRPVSIAGTSDGQARLTGSVQVFGQKVSASAVAALGTDNGDLTVQPSGLDTGTPLDQASRLLLRQRFSFVVPMDPLPFGQHLTGVHAQRSAVVVDARGDGVVVRP